MESTLSQQECMGLALYRSMGSFSIVTQREAAFIGPDANGHIVVVMRICVYSLLMTSNSLVQQKAKSATECEDERGSIRGFRKVKRSIVPVGKGHSKQRNQYV